MPIRRTVVSKIAAVAVLCAAFPAAVSGQTQVKPYIMILLDTSSSMLYDPRNTEVAPITGWETLGDGSNDDPYRTGWGRCCPGVDTDYDADVLPDDSRLFIAKDALRDIVSGYGDVQFGLMRYRADECAIGWGQDANVIVFPAYQANMSSGLGATVTQSSPTFPIPPFLAGTRELDLITYLGFNCRTGTAPNRICGIRDSGGTCNTAGPGGDVLVPFAEDNTNQILEWIDNTERFSSNPLPPTTGARRCAATTITNRELRATGFTPLARSIDSARAYFAGVRPGDPYRDCRGYFLVVITDGDDTCDGNPVQAVTNLLTAGVRSYTIGFAFMSATLNQMAAAGGTGRATAFNAASKDDLAAAFTQIIDDTVLTEICDGIDNDCDTLVDEGFTKYCNLRAAPPIPGRTLCTDPGEACNGVDDNCDTRVDEGVQNVCGGCGPVPIEVCNRIDDDCDGETDEGLICVPDPEICDGIDNDFDTLTDEDLGTRQCGSGIGECRFGAQSCVGGTWGACTGGAGPSAESCDNRDNDCDGMTDGMTRNCGTDVGVCEFGSRICTAGVWGACTGGYNGTVEVCNGLDDDCDTLTDEGDLGGGAPCGSSIGECRQGEVRCIGGLLVCNGGVTPVPELCDNRDNDCDGETDEGNPGGGAPCYSGSPATRGVGVCEDGLTRCVAGGFVCVGDTLPRAEVCNGLDDDCDTLADEDLPDGEVCGTSIGECLPGVRRCVGGRWACDGETPPRPEICNLRDDDCDGQTDEANPGGGVPCGWSPDAPPERWDTGLCEPGVTRCVDGVLECEGAVGPVPEICNGLDDDCDGVTDGGLTVGAECGSDVGACRPGTLQCVDGTFQCVGGVGPAPEICDCEDNNCNTFVDDDVICPGVSVCLDCSCSLPCNPDHEFSCPPGRCCNCGRTEDPEACYCGPCRCGSTTCGPCENCIDDACVRLDCGPCRTCLDATAMCVNICDPIVCEPGTTCVCDRCIPTTCYVPGHECPARQRCRNSACEDDPCHERNCPPAQFCREGDCFDTCGPDITCGDGERCRDGACVPDPCDGVTCVTPGIRCIGGICHGDPGTACEDVDCDWPLVCRDGACTEPECFHVRCPEGYRCELDTCVRTGGVPDAGTDADAEPAGREVLATGTGGCACRAPGGAPGGWSLAALGAALAAAGRVVRRRREGGGRCRDC